MIAWNAFYQYILEPTGNMKVLIILMLAAALILRRSVVPELIYRKFQTFSPRHALFWILLVGFGLRFFWVLWSPHVPPAAITEDENIWRHANELARGEGYLSHERNFTSYRPVGYPFFLSILIQLFGSQLWVAEFAQVLLGVGTIYGLYLMGCQLRSAGFGCMAALLFACYPPAVMATKLIADEHLFLLMWVIGIATLISDYQRPSYWKVVLAGIILGLSALVRTYSLVTIGAAFVAWGFAKRDWTSALLRTTLLGWLIFLCALPWGIRNYYRLGAFVLYTTIPGMQLYQANNPTSNVRYPVNPTIEHGCDPDFCRDEAVSEVEWDRAGRRSAWRWIRKNPGLFVQKTLGRSFYMWGLNDEGWVVWDNFNAIKEGSVPPSKWMVKKLAKTEQFAYVFLFWFFLFGLVLLFFGEIIRGEAKGWIYALMIVVLYVLVTSIALNHRKYKFALDPIFLLIAWYGFFQVFFGHVINRWRLGER